MSNQAGDDGFKWYIGTVASTADPLQLGRVRVRVVNETTALITDDNLPWHHVMLPVTSETYQGAGDTPMLKKGTTVFGFYMDANEKQLGMVIGALPVMPDMNALLSSIPGLARGSQTLNKELVGPEPASPYAAQYGYNRVIRTSGGHVIELDDTPENQRVHIWHNSGTYYEVDNDGQLTQKTVSDRYDIVSGNHNHYIDGDYNLFVSGKYNVIVQGDSTHVTEGDHQIVAAGSLSHNAANGIVHNSGTDIALKSPGGVGVPYSGIQAAGAMSSAVGITGAVTTPSGRTIHFTNGLATNITD